MSITQKGAVTLDDADDYVTVVLADGSEVEVYGDGIVHLTLDGGVRALSVNLYTVKEEEVV